MQDLPAMMKAAERGDAMAQVMVGMAYSNGKGVPQDRAKGVKWL
jgi:TPR repeat protein